MRVLSGLAPTGKVHIGNYLGAIKQWLELQEKEECIFFIADLHALTSPYNPRTFQKTIFDAVISYLAAGLDPEKCILFIQSQIKEHTELTWLLSTVTPVGDLLRMTQYKEKAKRFKKNVNAGLLNYPILQAADVLLYKAEAVPVGKDQLQHLELAREIARRFNREFGETFPEPKAILPKSGEKIMSLTEPKKKMSKSAIDPISCIYLFDEPDEIRKKIMAAVTDPGKVIKYSPSKPGISNLLTIYSLFSSETRKQSSAEGGFLFSGKSIKELEKSFKGKGYEEFKKSLIKLLINSLEPFRRKRKELLSREVYVKEILNQGAKKAQVIVQSTITDVRKKMGLV